MRIGSTVIPLELLMAIVAIIACAVATGKIAEKKGYSYNAFALLGLVLPLVGLIIAVALPDKSVQSAVDLVNYKKLLNDGVITQEEFDGKKRELLGR